MPGTFVYAPPAGTVLSVGASQPLSVTFTPTDTTTYTTASANVTITVTRAPDITGALAADITYGTTLGAAAQRLRKRARDVRLYTGGGHPPVGRAGQTLSRDVPAADTASYAQ